MAAAASRFERLPDAAAARDRHVSEELEEPMRIETVGIRSAITVVAAAIALGAGTKLAMAEAGMPTPWQMGMQDMVTELGASVSAFHTALVWLIAAVCVFVLALIVIIVIRFSEDKNPTPSRTTHHTWLEIAWTIVPVLILIAIAIPSFRILRQQLVLPAHDIVVKTTGYAWYWGYEYPVRPGRVQIRIRTWSKRRTSSPASLAC